MTDRYREATTLYQNALDADHRTSTDAAITLIATALSAAHEAGRLEEREACATRVITAWEALPGGEQLVWRVQGWLEKDMAQMVHGFRADLAVIRSREGSP